MTLASIGDAVITTDIKGRVTYLNAVAASLTGWTQQDAIGQPVQAVFQIVNEATRQPVATPRTRALNQGAVVLLRKHGGELPIDDSASTIRDADGRVSGCVLIFRDATAQRREAHEKAEELLGARQLASIVESSGDAIIGKSLDGTIQSWNDAAERVFGYPAAEAVGRHISLIIPPERLAEEDQIIATLKAGQRIDHFETERVRKDGRRILVSLTVSPIKDDAGNIVGASKVVRDVTRQRRADERERRLLADAANANAKFQAFFEQGALLAVIMELDGTIIAANRLSWEGCGYTREQIVGKRFWEGPWWASSPALRRQIEAASAQAIAGSTFRGETPYFVADGSERTADITIVPIKDETGKVLFVAPTGIDITDRKRAEADRQKFVTLVESSSDFIGMADLQGIPFFINRAGLAMVGLDDLEQARRVPWRTIFFPEDRPRIIEEFFPSVLAQGHGEIEIRFRHFKTGEARWMAYKVLTLPDDAGRPMAFATVSQDVTERRRLADDLSEANRRKTEFLAMLAHELRNPLAPISNAVRALRVGHGDAKVTRAALGMFERQVGQLARLVDDLLDLSRITRGKIVLRKQSVELVPIVEQAVEAMRARYGSLNHELTVTLPTQPVYLSGDPARLAQVIGNLLNNACKFTDPGGHIALTVTHEGAQAVVRVRDNGIGIAAEQLPHLFDMFTQADTSLERTRDGLGIGLTLVKALVGDARRHSRGAQRRARSRQRVRGAPAGAGGSFSDDRAGSRERTDDDRGPPHPDRGRQHRRSGIAGDAAGGGRARDAQGARRRRGARDGRTPSARRHAAGHRAAEVERLRGLPAHPGAPLGRGADDRGADRLGARRGPPAIAGGRLRHPPGQAGRSRDPDATARRPPLPPRRHLAARRAVTGGGAARLDLSTTPGPLMLFALSPRSGERDRVRGSNLAPGTVQPADPANLDSAFALYGDPVARLGEGDGRHYDRPRAEGGRRRWQVFARTVAGFCRGRRRAEGRSPCWSWRWSPCLPRSP